MDEGHEAAPVSSAPAAIRPQRMGSVLRGIRDKLELVPLVRPPIEEEPQIVIDLLKHTDIDLPVAEPPRAVRPGRTKMTTESGRYTRRPRGRS